MNDEKRRGEGGNGQYHSLEPYSIMFNCFFVNQKRACQHDIEPPQRERRPTRIDSSTAVQRTNGLTGLPSVRMVPLLVVFTVLALGTSSCHAARASISPNETIMFNRSPSSLPSTLIFIKSDLKNGIESTGGHSNHSSSSSSGRTEYSEAANDEEALPPEDSSHSFMFPLDSYPGESAGASSWNDSKIFPSTFPLDESSSMSGSLGKNCSYINADVFCSCNLLARRYSCYNIQSVADIRLAFEHLLNTTRLIYWFQLEIHCIEPYSSDQPTIDSKQLFTAAPNRSFHISYEMFNEGPKFESIIFDGDCSKPKHYDNLIMVDRDVQRLVMVRNMLRMATSCSLLQPKFERLQELTLKDCVVAGDMISSTFSTRCLGK